ncbi:MAG: hypothetical protein ACE5JU_20660 [Candidatus Binatia bacterium]
MITAPIDVMGGQTLVRELSTTGAGAAAWTQILCTPASGMREIVLLAYMYHNDTAAAHACQWTWHDRDDNEISLYQTSQSNNIWHWLHSSAGVGTNPSIWLHFPVQDFTSYLIAECYDLPAAKTLKAKLLVMELTK